MIELKKFGGAPNGYPLHLYEHTNTLLVRTVIGVYT
jgi:hypothetical protein